MKPEQRVANRLFTKLRLSIPIDVEALARHFAEVEEDDFPTNSDAVVITTPSAHQRPLIILNKRAAKTRKRFTLAHEIGHIVIPWHMGTFACHTTGGIRLGEQLYVTTEAESNRFASELLLPIDWLKNVASSGMSPAQMLKFVRSTADVSSDAASLAMVQVLAPGIMFAVTDSNGFVAMAATSPDSTIRTPRNGDLLDVKSYSSRCSLYETVSAGNGRNVHWWKYIGTTITASAADQRGSAEILKAIVESCSINPSQARTLTQRVAGIVGAANGGRKPDTTEELLDILCQTFTDRPDLIPVTSHPDFDTFLAKKADEIIKRRLDSL